MKEELYEKVGRRYVRVNDPWAYDGLQEGHHHVWVRRGSVTVREFVLPDRRDVSAAIEEVRKAMTTAMYKANKATPRNRSLTNIERRAIRAYREVMGEDASMTFDGVSMCDLVDAGIKVLVDHYKDPLEEEPVEYKGYYICHVGSTYLIKLSPLPDASRHTESFVTVAEAKDFIDKESDFLR